MYFSSARRCLTGAAVSASLVVGSHAVLAQSQPADVAIRYAQEQKQRFGLVGSDLNEVVLSSAVTSDHNGVTHVYLQQRYRGLEVWSALITVNVAADGTVISAGSRFVSNIAAAAGGQNARKSAVDAASAAAAHLKLRPSRSFEVISRKGGVEQATTLSTGGIAARPIDARLVWYAVGDAVRLAWMLEIEETDGQHWWHAFVDATDGTPLGQENLVISDSPVSTAAAIASPSALQAALPSFPPTDGASYRVFALPFESPTDGDRTLVTNAANPNGSPLGWHDTNGVAGPEFTVTRGNNVHAYTDIDANNVADPGSDPDGGASLTFDFPLDLSLNPPTYRPAAVTNLFYWNNIVHDISYEYGFNEASGNFQVNNYGRGGLGNDDVRAEAQDGSGTNNANFFTPVDGLRPRMQMFVWTSPNVVTITSPAAIAGDYAASSAAFGPPLTVAGISGTLSLVNDGAGASTSDACEPLVGFPAGAIALLDRGNCTFVIKVKNAQLAGAIAALVVNNAAGPPATMGGTDPTITIPSAMVSLNDGGLFKANLPAQVIMRVMTVNRDSDLDAGVIAHEYAHGISNRLTGGPNVVNCLNNAEQMGEGWSDWFALVYTTDPGDSATTPRGIASYLSFQPADGLGIRPTQYTTDFTVNPSTYAWVANPNISQPHGIGYVWNSMLWEVYWNLVDKYGYNANVYGAWDTGGNNLAIQLVMDGMKFQVCRPGFVDGRNAILQADQALTGGANQCEIWRGFAKRGLGFSANQGLATNRSDGVEAFDLPASCTSAVFGGFEPPIENAPAINAANAGSTVPVKFTLTGADDLSIDSQEVVCSTLEPTGDAPSPLDSPGSTGLSQDGDEYRVNWQTDPSWAGTCRRLTLRIPAASDAVAYFRFF